MKILYVYGGEDYAAVTFEDEIGIVKAKKIIGDKKLEVEFADGIYGRIIEFNDVDLEFIKFIRNEIQDYDQSKHANFYII